MPNAKRQGAPPQGVDFGGCDTICDPAITSLAPFCADGNPDTCRQACSVDQYIMPLNDCVNCLVDDPEASEDARTTVEGWLDGILNICNNPETTPVPEMYGSCTMCEEAVSEFSFYCDSAPDDQCRQACPVSHLVHS